MDIMKQFPLIILSAFAGLGILYIGQLTGIIGALAG